MTQVYRGLEVRWDPTDLEIRTRSVEKMLEPLVVQVTTLVNQDGNRKIGEGGKGRGSRSKKAHVLAAAVECATEQFIVQGELIAMENDDIRDEMLKAVDEVRNTGGAMHECSHIFAADPCQSTKRASMILAARALLSSVTRLLILADLVDIHLLLRSLRVVESDLEAIRNASNQNDLLQKFKDFGRNIGDLNYKSAIRQRDLKDIVCQEDLAAARATLRKNSKMLLTSSKAYIRHPELAAARANRDYIIDKLEEAVHQIESVAMEKHHRQANNACGDIAAALDQFDRKIIMDPSTFDRVLTKTKLQQMLEGIVGSAALLADEECTRDDRRERIIKECNAVRAALQDLIGEYINNNGQKEPTENLNLAVDQMNKTTRELRRQLRRTVVDHVSDVFVDTDFSLLVLIEAASAGNQRVVEQYAKVFTEHAHKLIEVAHMACSISSCEEGIKMVRLATEHMHHLAPEVVNAARILAARPSSKVAQDNMSVFKDTWLKEVELLTEAIDEIITIDDFLAVSENHILEDVNRCVVALKMGDAEELSLVAKTIRGRCLRIDRVVHGEMMDYEKGAYTDRVLQTLEILRDQVMPHFSNEINNACIVLDSENADRVYFDENEFIDASRLVYDGVREVRRAVLTNRTLEELESDTEIEFDEEETRSRCSYVEEQENVEFEEQSDRAMMRMLPQAEKDAIQQQVALFREERVKLMNEISKWDSSGNDIIVIAKEMCIIMMEMTDFTRGRGPLKTTMDVINAAKKISNSGSNLDDICMKIGEQCPESSSKNELEAYRQRITLYCHQLNITSKVKADVQNTSGALIVSGLDSATSLIQASKNLMNAVVSAVKASYVASTKYSRISGVNNSVVTWRMKAPEKKPLVHRDTDDEVKAKVRKGAKNKSITPIKALSEFQELESF